MRWPWTSRADLAHERAACAEKQLEQVRGQWSDVEAVAGESRQHRELNGWTRTVTTIFSGR